MPQNGLELAVRSDIGSYTVCILHLLRMMKGDDMTVKCPHCGEAIEVLAPKEMDELGINSNKRQYRKRNDDSFPDPWMSFENRDVWLRDDITLYLSRKEMEGLQSLTEAIGKMDPDEALKLLDGLRDTVKQ
jgi:hypothetical protein